FVWFLGGYVAGGCTARSRARQLGPRNLPQLFAVLEVVRNRVRILARIESLAQDFPAGVPQRDGQIGGDEHVYARNFGGVFGDRPLQEGRDALQPCRRGFEQGRLVRKELRDAARVDVLGEVAADRLGKQ